MTESGSDGSKRRLTECARDRLGGADREGGDGESWVGGADTREDAAAQQIEILMIVRTQVRVDHRCRWITSHAVSAHHVSRPLEQVLSAVVVERARVVWLKPGEIHRAHLRKNLLRDLTGGGNARLCVVVEIVSDLRPWNSKIVLELRRQLHAICRERQLFHQGSKPKLPCQNRIHLLLELEPKLSTIDRVIRTRNRIRSLRDQSVHSRVRIAGRPIPSFI